jgi:single-strand DNA-binding protein
MQVATLAGNLGKDAEFKTTQGGDQFCRFTVAVTTGWGDRKATTWWDVTRWGKGADKLADMLTKGTKVCVVGEVSTREHEGKTYLQLRADHVTLQGGKQDSGGGYEPRQQSPTGRVSDQRQGGQGGYRASAQDDLDDDVPF